MNYKNLFKHKHKWQTRGQNKWFITTYRVCLKCGHYQKRVHKSGESDRFEKCDRVLYLDEFSFKIFII